MAESEQKTNYVDHEVLTAILDWLLRRRADEPGANFSLTLIEFHDPTLLGEMLGASRASRVLDEFGRSLVEALRAGDIVTRFVSTFCVLTPSGKTDKLLERLREAIVSRAGNGLETVEYSVRSYNFPSENTKIMSGAQLLKALSDANALVPARTIARGTVVRA